MNFKNPRLRPFYICLLLFAAGLCLSLPFTGQGGTAFARKGPVVLSEVLASNQTYPAPDGRYLDYIELQNVSDSPVDISGYKLSDNSVSIGYVFPTGTILQAGDYIVCWCDKQDESGLYARFGISRKGGDSICLYNSANVLIDSQQMPRTDANTALIRLEDGSWQQAEFATPGFANTAEGYEAWLASQGGYDAKVVISEVMSRNACVKIDGKDRICDWVELQNLGDAPLVLSGAFLSDDPQDPTKWKIPQLVVDAGGYALIPCVGKGAAENEADFALSKSGCSLLLTGALGNLLTELDCPELAGNSSFARMTDGTYAVSETATPGFENSENGYTAWLQAVGGKTYDLVISEVVTRGRIGVLNQAGRLCDWVEIQNVGTETAELGGTYLSEDEGKPAKWQLPPLSLAPGECVVIPCVGAEAAEGEASFALPAEGCTLTLTGAVGNRISRVDCPALGEGHSWALQADGSYLETAKITPAYNNSEEGRETYLLEQRAAGPLAITEVMPANRWYLQQSDGKYYDWVEITNISGEAVNVAGYCLSDKWSEPGKLLLPDRTLEPGERMVVICCGSAQLEGRGIFAPFSLNSEECWVYLTNPQGEYSDMLHAAELPYRSSTGRGNDGQGQFYYSDPTPNAENGTGAAMLSGAPVFSVPGGIYNDVDSLTISLEGPGEIYYTLNGNRPDRESQLYTEPITVSSTTVLRAVCYEPGKLAGEVTSESYIVNEYHSLPVVSLSANDIDLYGIRGIYTDYEQEKEIPANIQFFEDAGSFSIDCGLEMHGHTGLENPKKSFKANFRGSYGSTVLSYPLFGEDGPEIFDSLCLRSGQDYPRAIIRDELFEELAWQMGDSVVVQHSKYCILYVNGEYYGIYCIKEAFSETFYAQNYNVSADSVSVEQAPVVPGNEMMDVLHYCWYHDLYSEEDYAYVASRVDVDSVIDWIILQGYSTNGDVQQNLRYFKSTENGNKWQMAFYDLDWAFYYHYEFGNVLNVKENWQHMALTRGLMQNAVFRERFLSRLSSLMQTTLSDENVISVIDRFHDILEPEIDREREMWGGNRKGWENSIQELRDFILEGHLNTFADCMRAYIGLTEEEYDRYFRGVLG